MTAADVEYDPYSYELDVDPYPVYRHLLEHDPAYYNERLDFWAFTRFDDCLAAFYDWETYSSAHGTVLELMKDEVTGPLIIFMDPPRQTRLRNLVSKVFTPRRISALEPAIRKIAADAAKNDNRMSSFILGVVNSAPFRMSVAETDDTETEAETIGAVQNP